MEVYEHDDSEASKLTEADKKKIRRLIKQFNGMLPDLNMPIEPNVYTLVEVCVNILEQQLHSEMHFTYETPDGRQVEPKIVDKVVKEVKKEQKRKKEPPLISSTPTADELAEWFEQESDEDE